MHSALYPADPDSRVTCALLLWLHLQAILPALCAAVLDEEAGAAVCACATVLGCFCLLERLLDLLTPRMEDWSGEPRHQAGGLTLLTAFLRWAGSRSCHSAGAARQHVYLEMCSSSLQLDSC